MTPQTLKSVQNCRRSSVHKKQPSRINNIDTVGVYYIGSAGDLNLQIGSIKIFQLSEIPVARNPGEAVGRTPSSEAEGRT